MKWNINGVNNFFADILSRNPVGLDKGSRKLMKRERELLVAKIDFGADKTLLKKLGNLSQHHLSDPVLTKIRELVEREPDEYKGRYMNRNKILFVEMTGRTLTEGQCSLGI
jgi:hypothetical protein